ncbi:unnamed protein product [Nezara viridula]|uniref:Uncharacterized protein n=1 Tax=Nezara viridula TaxID=85310 RepID=A0A9P0HGQ7_NEZVI|nr:unnamed protein product [Nezara viridula]
MSSSSMTLEGLLMFGIGPYVSYLALTLFGGAIAVMFAVLFYFAPESPYYFYKKGRKRDAEDALQWLKCYRTRERLEEELAAIEESNVTS